MSEYTSFKLLPAEEAEKHCLRLMDQLENRKRIDFSTTPATAADSRLSTKPLFGDARGQMFGILICKSNSSDTGPIILRAFSGQFNGVWEVAGWVPPVLDSLSFLRAVENADPAIKALTARIKNLSDGKDRAALIEQRRELSQKHALEIHSMYNIKNFNGDQTDLFSLFEGKSGIPAGTGDCCAPKLLNQAILLGLKPLSMAEFYWGRENRSGKKQHRCFYPPCLDKCMPILRFMYLGIHNSKSPNKRLLVHYCDDSIVVIEKPVGMLSIPGRGPEKQDSAASRVRELFTGCIEQPSVHRLDMDTSGLMVFALTSEAHRSLSIQFQNSEVHKKYSAVLEGLISEEKGRTELRFRLDPANRPYQVFDPERGKTGITIWKKLSEADGRTRVEFTPLTGRTHQLRLHSAHPWKSDRTGGLGCPIVGDRLYGKSNDAEHAEGIRMFLHASELEFIHPDTGRLISFSSEVPF